MPKLGYLEGVWLLAAMKLGIIIGLTDHPEVDLGKARELDLPTCQLACWQPDMLTESMAEKVKAASEETGVEIHDGCGVGGLVQQSGISMMVH